MAPSQIHGAAGNAMTLPVIRAVLKEALRCAGITDRGVGALHFPNREDPASLQDMDSHSPLTRCLIDLDAPDLEIGNHGRFAGDAHPGNNMLSADSPMSDDVHSVAVSGLEKQEGAECDHQDVAWRSLGDLGRRLCKDDEFGNIFAALKRPIISRTRVRDIFPLPSIAIDFASRHIHCSYAIMADACAYLDLVIVALNWLRGVRASGIGLRTPTAAHLESHSVIVEAAIGLLGRLTNYLGDRAVIDWESFEEGGVTLPLEFKADIVAVPTCAGTCDPRMSLRGIYLTVLAMSRGSFLILPRDSNDCPASTEGRVQSISH